MVTFSGLNQFWKRVGTSKLAMSTLEIREHCMRAELLQARLEDFLDRQWELARNYTVNRHGQYFSVTPLLLDDKSVQVFDTVLQEDIYKVMGPPGTTAGLRFGAIRPSLYGVENERNAAAGLFRLFRNGHLDYTYLLEQRLDLRSTEVSTGTMREARTVLHQTRWARLPLELLRLTKTIYRQALLTAPVIVEYGLVNAITLNLPISSGHPNAPSEYIDALYVRQYEGPEQHIRIQMQFDSDWEPTTVAKALVDRFWNAFQWPHCPFAIEASAPTSP
jgi:hypothetical protein